MNCERCLGFMILDAYSDRYETARCPPLVWRCLNCGDLIDSQILTHRMLQKRKAVKPSPAASAWYIRTQRGKLGQCQTYMKLHAALILYLRQIIYEEARHRRPGAGPPWGMVTPHLLSA
jgi:hypothetical protein